MRMKSDEKFVTTDIKVYGSMTSWYGHVLDTLKDSLPCVECGLPTKCTIDTIPLHCSKECGCPWFQ